MTVTRTVKQTVAGIVDSYRKEIEQAAGDSTLSKTEESKLTPFAKKHIDEARKAGKAMTVTQAVDALEPVITRAVQSIAGADGKVDASEVSKLRVMELRTRAANLFGEPPAADEAALKSALDGVNVAKITDYGRSFELGTAAVGATPESIVSKLTDIDPADLGSLSDYATIVEGTDAVADFSSVVRQAGSDIVDGADDPVAAADSKARLEALAEAVDGFFKPGDFTRIMHLRHTIAEDGDTERSMLLAQKPDGSWKTLTYTNFPF